MDTINELSTTSPNLSGDGKLSILQKVIWFYRCQRENSAKALSVDKKVDIVNYRFNDISNDSNASTLSPVRLLCNAFWSELDLSSLCQNGGGVRVLETGCGSGIYGHILQKKLGNGLARYRGVDIQEHQQWRGLMESDKFEFFIDRAENIGEYLSNINLIITQSALEHFEYDLKYFRHISDYVERASYPVWQVHLLPSAECLITYLWHGYRRYTVSSISKISRLFSDRSKVVLFRLGGNSINKVHLKYITWPSLLLRTDLARRFPKTYINDISSAILNDQERSERTDASFYALCIKSNDFS